MIKYYCMTCKIPMIFLNKSKRLICSNCEKEVKLTKTELNEYVNCINDTDNETIRFMCSYKDAKNLLKSIS